MTKYIVKLTEQEELTLRQLAVQAGFEVLFKLLQGESLDAQTAAMECRGTQEERLLKLAHAQATAEVVGNLIRKLVSYQNVIEPTVEEIIEDPLGFNLFNKRSN